LIFNRDELESIAAWTKTAKPLTGIYYRSVEYRYMDPKEVLSGRGAAQYGGRFASVGTRAVYLAESDGGASGEVLARPYRHIHFCNFSGFVAVSGWARCGTS